MSRLTLRLPESLHRQLEALATSESVSLNQYIVYALTKQVTQAYTVQAVPQKAIAEQHAAYTTLLQSLGKASLQEVRKILDERETAQPEADLTPNKVEKLRQKISQQSP